MAERLQKIIARAGVCSRRAAEELLAQGRVRVNGRIAALGDKAEALTDRIELDGEPLPDAPQAVYLMLHKPRGYVTTLSDEQGRATAAELVADCGARVYPVGRLDRDSEGLLLFTNDGALTQALLHPRMQVDKVYEVTVTGQLEGAAARLAAIDHLDDGPIAPCTAAELCRRGEEAVLRVTIHQGKKRQVRRMCAQVGLAVRRLVRVQEASLRLGDLKCGKWRYLTDAEITALKGDHSGES